MAAKVLLEQSNPAPDDSLNTSVSSPMMLSGITLSTVYMLIGEEDVSPVICLMSTKSGCSAVAT